MSQQPHCCVCGHDEAPLSKTPERCEYDGWGDRLCSECCSACDYHASCAERYTVPSIMSPDEIAMPDKFIDQVTRMHADFKSRPGDYDAFMRLDWALRVAMAKWESYSAQRKIADCAT
jgi:hypothetical protein